MRKGGTRFWWPWPKGRESRKMRLLSAALGIALALLLIHRADEALRPHLLAIAEGQARNEITQIADRAVSRVFLAQGITYEEMVTFSEGSGEVVTLSTDTVKLNDLRAAILEDIITQAKTLDGYFLEIPLGTLTGIDLFSALGMDLPVRLLSVSSVEGNFHNEFTSTGVNQTLYRVMLEVSVTVKFLLPSGVATEEIRVPVPVAETVIVGKPPQTYLNLNQ